MKNKKCDCKNCDNNQIGDGNEYCQECSEYLLKD